MYRVLGFRVLGVLAFRVSGFRAQGQGLGFYVSTWAESVWA